LNIDEEEEEEEEEQVMEVEQKAVKRSLILMLLD